THAAKAPMTIASRAQHTRVNATAVVPDDQAKAAGRIPDLHLNLFRMRVPKRIDQRFATDTIDLIAQHRMERTGLAPNKYAELTRVVDAEFLPYSCKQTRQVFGVVFGRTKTSHCVPAFIDYPSHQNQHMSHGRLDGRIIR